VVIFLYVDRKFTGMDKKIEIDSLDEPIIIEDLTEGEFPW
jgi:hypothetical protein